MGNRGMRASDFLEKRSQLLELLGRIDDEIDKALGKKPSRQAAVDAKTLFTQRQVVVDALEDFDVFTDPHPAVWSG